MENDTQEVSLENQIFYKGQDEQVAVAENQVAIEFVPKPDCILPMVNVTSEFVPRQECKPQIATLEDRLNSEYVDSFWEAVKWQQEASKKVGEVANQIESSIPTAAVTYGTLTLNTKNKKSYVHDGKKPLFSVHRTSP